MNFFAKLCIFGGVSKGDFFNLQDEDFCVLQQLNLINMNADYCCITITVTLLSHFIISHKSSYSKMNNVSAMQKAIFVMEQLLRELVIKGNCAKTNCR